MDNISALKIINAIKEISGQNKKSPETLVFGKVKTLNPLSIEIRENFVIPESHLFLGQMCRPHKVKIPHTHQYNGSTENATTGMTITTVGQATTTVVDSGHTHDIKNQVTEDVHKKNTDYEKSVTLEIEPKLKVGDMVLMFAFNNYQMYYVAERIEEE